MRTAYVQLAILALCVATLLDDGLFLVVVTSMAVVAIVLCGGRRLMAAASVGAARPREPVQSTPGSMRIGQPAPSPATEYGFAVQD